MDRALEAAVKTVFGRLPSHALESLLDEALSPPSERVPLSQLRMKQAKDARPYSFSLLHHRVKNINEVPGNDVRFHSLTNTLKPRVVASAMPPGSPSRKGKDAKYVVIRFPLQPRTRCQCLFRLRSSVSAYLLPISPHIHETIAPRSSASLCHFGSC